MAVTPTTPGRFLVTFQPEGGEPVALIDTTIYYKYVQPITMAGLDAVNRAIADDIRLDLETQAAPVIAKRQAPIEAAQADAQAAFAGLEA
jgi:hypothetical protein